MTSNVGSEYLEQMSSLGFKMGEESDKENPATQKSERLKFASALKDASAPNF